MRKKFSAPLTNRMILKYPCETCDYVITQNSNKLRVLFKLEKLRWYGLIKFSAIPEYVNMFDSLLSIIKFSAKLIVILEAILQPQQTAMK